MRPDEVRICLPPNNPVPGLLLCPDGAFSCYVMAHGAGAGMAHPFMAAVADGLARRGVATLRYEFPYMAAGSRRPDRPALAHATVRAAVEAAAVLVPSLPLFAGGKSFGGRMTSGAQAAAPLPGVRGLVFLGFPLHPAGKPSVIRAAHLAAIAIPMLFLAGTRDALADINLLVPAVEQLGDRATLGIIEGADHSFHVPAKSGRNDRQALDQAFDMLADWLRTRTATTDGAPPLLAGSFSRPP